MKLDNIWKQPFQDPNINKSIAQLSFESMFQIIKTGEDFEFFYQNSTDKFREFADFHEHSDISSLNKIIKFNCGDIINRHTINGLKEKIPIESKISFFMKSPRLSNIYPICQYIAKVNKMPDNIIARLYYKDQRYSELNQIITFLILYRNYSAHSTKERNDLGLCLSVGSKLLRYTELLELDNNWTEKIQNLREQSIKIIKDTFLNDPTDEISTETKQIEEIGQDSLILQEISNNISFIKDNLINSQKTIKENQISNEITNHEEFIEDSSMDYEIYQDYNLTITQLKQKLLELRKIIAKEFALKNDNQNIMSKEIVDKVILLGVNNKREWKKISSVQEHYPTNSKIMDKQIDQYWSSIQDLLSTINWLEDY